MKLSLEIENQIKYQMPPKKVIEGWILAVLKDKKIDADIEIGLKIVSKEVIHKFNKKYRKIDSPTDVLSFPIYDKLSFDSKEPILLGDIVICPEIMAENAKKYGNFLKNEFKKLIVHSTLHLIGIHHNN